MRRVITPLLAILFGCSRNTPEREYVPPASWITSQQARWDALAVIPDTLPKESYMLLETPRAEAARWCEPSGGVWDAPDLIIVHFRDTVSLERRVSLLAGVRGKAVASPRPRSYLIWLRPTGHCDASAAARELALHTAEVSLAIPEFVATFEFEKPSKVPFETPRAP